MTNNESDKKKGTEKEDKNEDDDDNPTDFTTIRYADKYADKPISNECWYCPPCGKTFQSRSEFLQHALTAH